MPGYRAEWVWCLTWESCTVFTSMTEKKYMYVSHIDMSSIMATYWL